MRSMLKLVLLCLLAQLARSDKQIEGCGDIYACHVPGVCIDSSLQRMGDSSVEPLPKNKPVFDNCPAVIKIHEYRPNWAYVWIESPAGGTTSIDFIEYDKLYNVKTKLSCAIAGGKIEGKYSTISNNQLQSSTKFSKGYTPGHKLMCKFDVRRLLSSEKMFSDYSQNGIFLFDVTTQIGPEKTQHTNSLVLIKTGCDPSKLKFDKEINHEEVYAKIQFEPGHYFCDYPKIFKKKYYKNGKYIPVNNIGCHRLLKTFEMDGAAITTDTVDARCVAEVQFFCNDYLVKKKDNSEFPKQDNSNWADPIPMPSTLTCPPDQPHLIINTKLVLNANSKIKCVNYGSSKYWTVEDNGESHRLTSNGPEVKCTATVDCDQKFKISEAAVPTGRLGLDRFPECFATGVLKVNGAAITDHRCDRSTGEFKFKTGGQEQIVTPDTKFVCEYPGNKEEAELENKKQKWKIGKGIIGSIVGSLVLVGIVIAVAVVVLKRRQKRDMKRAVERNEVVFSKFGMTEEEKAAYEKKEREKKEKEKEKKKKGSEEDDEKENDEKVEEADAQAIPKMDETWTWNQYLTHYRKQAWAAATFALTAGLWTGSGQSVENHTDLPNHANPAQMPDVSWKVPKCEKRVAENSMKRLEMNKILETAMCILRKEKTEEEDE